MSDTFNVLRKIVNLLNKNEVHYVIGGNTGLIIQGVNVEDDEEIDICTNKEGAYKIQKILSKFTVEKVQYKNFDWFKSHLGVFKIDNITIEVMGNPKRRFDDDSWRGLPKKNITKVKYKDFHVNVFTLESEYEYYKNISKHKPDKKKIYERIIEYLR